MGKPVLNVELEVAKASEDSCEGTSAKDEDPNHLSLYLGAFRQNYRQEVSHVGNWSF